MTVWKRLPVSQCQSLFTWLSRLVVVLTLSKKKKKNLLVPPNLHIFAQWIPVLSAWRCGSLYSFMVNVFSQMVSHGAECRVRMSLRRTAVTSQAICFACFQGVPLSWLPCLWLLTEHTGHTGHRHVLFSLSNVPCYHHSMPRICSAVFSVVNLLLMLLGPWLEKRGGSKQWGNASC